MRSERRLVLQLLPMLKKIPLVVRSAISWTLHYRQEFRVSFHFIAARPHGKKEFPKQEKDVATVCCF